MKKFGANLFLFSLLMGMLLMPVASLKLAKLNEQEVLSYTDIETKYLRQRIDEQDKEIKRLRVLLDTKETTESTESLEIITTEVTN
jgi:hypothetical protein